MCLVVTGVQTDMTGDQTTACFMGTLCLFFCALIIPYGILCERDQWKVPNGTYTRLKQILKLLGKSAFALSLNLVTKQCYIVILRLPGLCLPWSSLVISSFEWHIEMNLVPLLSGNMNLLVMML